MGCFTQLAIFERDPFPYSGCRAGVERYHLHKVLDFAGDCSAAGHSIPFTCQYTGCASGEKWHQAPLPCIGPQGHICIQVDYHVDAFVGQFLALELRNKKMTVWPFGQKMMGLFGPIFIHLGSSSLLNLGTRSTISWPFWNPQKSEKNQKSWKARSISENNQESCSMAQIFAYILEGSSWKTFSTSAL